MHPLDNVVWAALASHHEPFAVGTDLARRYSPDVSPFCAVRDDADRGCWDALAALVPPVGLVRSWTLPDVGPRLRVRDAAPILQLIHDPSRRVAPAVPAIEACRLGAAEAQEMLALARLAEPGPFERRTVELGRYIGVRDEGGQLVAMAGERARLHGWTEISAVCTHPDHRGRGLAAALVMQLVDEIRGRGAEPFMHVRGINVLAQRLYARLGFVVRRRGYALALERHGA